MNTVPKLGALASALLLLASASLAGERQAQSAAPLIDPKTLVRQAVANEVKAAHDDLSMMYRVRRASPKGVQTREYVETKDGTVGMAVAYDDRPLTPEQRQQEFERLDSIMSNPSELRKKQQQQKEDTERVTRMVQTLPDAFNYRYDGNEIGKNGDELVRLKFWPNPNFSPPSREQQVFTGMNGFLLVDAERKRIARIDGTLFKDVNFGWGILGHLDKGGRFIVVQGPVLDNYWNTTHMELNFTGKALFFHTINIQTVEDSSFFRRIANHLSFAQGVELLKKQDGIVAQNEDGRATNK